MEWTAVIRQGIDSELVARVVAVFTSVFAAADALIHLATGMYKGICLLAGAGYNKSVVYGHFRQAAWFAVLTVVGSIAGVIWPGVFKHCRYSPPPPSDDLLDVSDDIKELSLLALNSENNEFVVNQFKELWSKSSLEDKNSLVRVFNIHNNNFTHLRDKLADTVYRSIHVLNSSRVTWLCPEEIDSKKTFLIQGKSCKRSFFYHATSELALESILKSGKIEVRHEKAFRGAFVSNRPETDFGNCILAFNRNIERLSSLEHGFQTSEKIYWAGFSRDIPVSSSTLACIMLDSENEQECKNLAEKCKIWAGRSINVVWLQSGNGVLEFVQGLNMGIPSEWPLESNQGMSQQILATLKARVVIPAQTSVLRPRDSAESDFMMAMG